MVPADDCPKETRDEYSSKIIWRDCGVGCGCACDDDVVSTGTDRTGMQRQIPGCEVRRHARGPEVERLPESPVRRRRCCRSGGRASRGAKGSRQEGIEEGRCQGGCGACRAV